MSVTDLDTAPLPRLQEKPDWVYLLREFKDLYRRGKAGGSARIRSHQRQVREAVARTMCANPPVLGRPPELKPVTAHLKRALDQGRRESTQSVIRAVESVASEFTWLYGYEKVPRGLGQKFAYTEFAGPHGPILTEEIILGLVLFAPGCTYPAHCHDGLTESYYILSGAVSENDDGVYAPGSLILNPPGRMHRITVSETEPALLTYAWHGPKDKLAAQKMVFGRARGGREKR
ncbi:MAG: dimethylsulfonioproprionate lyase family protein [Pseudomonadota bacterium]